MDVILRSSAMAATRATLPRRIVATPSPSPDALRGGPDRSGSPPYAQAADTTAEQRRLADSIRSEIEAQRRQQIEQEQIAARREGYEAGWKQAQSDAESQQASARAEDEAALRQLVEALEHAHAQALAKLEDDVGEIAFAAVCQIAGDEAVGEALVRGLVGRACAALRRDGSCTVRLHPDDLARMDTAFGAGAGDAPSTLRFVADPDLDIGDCVVQTERGEIDASLSTQLSRLHAVLLARRDGVGD